MTDNNKKDWKGFLKFCFESPENIFQTVTVLSAIIAIILELFHVLDEHYLIPIILSILAAIGANLLLDKRNREESISIIHQEHKKVSTLIDRISTDIRADVFFSTETSERDLIISAEKELIIIQETSNLFADTYRNDLTNFLKRGGKVRWINVINSNTVTELMAFRNFDLTLEKMQNRMKYGNDMIETINSNAIDNHYNLEVRYFPYPTDITGIIKDSNHQDKSKRVALIRLQGFQVGFNEKLDFKFNEATSPKVFKNYLNQIEKIWKNCSKCLLLTGEPKIGKSSLLNEIITDLKTISDIEGISKYCIGGIITLEQLDKSGNRIGFEALNIRTGVKSQIATKNVDSEGYTLMKEVFEQIVIKEIRDSLSVCSLLVIDEIGPIQLNSQEYISLLREVFKNKNISIIGIVAKQDNSIISSFAKSYRTRLFELSSSNRESIKKTIKEEFQETKGKTIIV